MSLTPTIVPEQGRTSTGAPSIVPTLADIVREASRRVPLNNLGLPEGFHRPDLLHPDSDIVLRVVPQEELLKLPNGTDLSQGVYTDSGPLLVLDDKLTRLAYVPLDYHEGFPTLPYSLGGSPFWTQLPFEPLNAFKIFERYVKQGTDTGVRRLFALAAEPDIQQYILGLPQLPPPHHPPTPTLVHTSSGAAYHSSDPDSSPAPNSDYREAKEAEIARAHERNVRARQEAEDRDYEQERDRAGKTNQKLKEWHAIYYWSARARAHDLFYLDSIRQGQGMMALQLQNTHYLDAQRLYEEVMGFIRGDKKYAQDENGEPRFWKDMTPRVLVEFMKALTHMSRVSLGLPGGTPASIESPTSAVGLLHTLLNTMPPGHSGQPGAGPGSSISIGANISLPNMEHRGRGRPRSTEWLDPDLPDSMPAQGPAPTGNSSGSHSNPQYNQGPMQSDGDEERVRRISVLFNSAKQRRDAHITRQSRPAPATPQPQAPQNGSDDLDE